MRQTLLARTLFARTRFAGAGGLFVLASLTLLLGIGMIVVLQRDMATAAPQSTVNFQARLKSGSGAVVSDGYYNVHFRLYTASSGGASVWDERYIDENGTDAGSDNRVRTLGGYLNVSLGSITPFPSTIDWGEEMWLTLDVGGASQVVAGSIVWDGEMSPRIKLTAVPYAFKAEQAKTLQNTNGANQSTLGWETQTASNTITLPDASGVVCLQASTACGFAPATGGTGYIQNSTIQQTATNFNIDGSANAGTLNATTDLQLNGNNINTAGTLTNIAYLNQVTTFKATADSIAAFRVQNAAGTSTVLNVDTAGGVVSAGTASTADTLTALTNPSTLTGSQLSATAWSSDSKYLAIGADSASTDRLLFYKRTGDTLAVIGSQPAVLPGSNVKSIAWSPDTRYVAVGSNTTTSTKLTIYSRTGDVFTELADPATLPGNGVMSATWSPDGAYLSVASDAVPSLTTYKRTGDTFTKIADPDIAPGITASTASWSPDGNYLAFGHATTGTDRFKIYKRTGDRLIKLTDPATLPGGAVYSTAWSSDGTYLAVGSAATPFITIYKRSGDTFAKLTNPTYLPTGAGEVRSVDFSSDGMYLALAGNTNGVDRFVVYKRTGDTFSQVTPGATPGNFAMSLDMSADGAYLAVASNNGSGNRFTWMRIGNGTHADFTVSGNANVAGQVVASSLSTSSITAGAASFGTLAAASATVQSQAVIGALTVGGHVSLASSTGTPGLLQLGVMNSVTDPATGSNGAMYFNSSLNVLRCYLNGAWANCANPSGGGTVFTQGGNAFGDAAVLGTNDAYGLSIMTNSTTLASISPAGDITFTPTNELRVQSDGGADLVNVDVVGGDVTFGSTGLGTKVNANGSLSVSGGLNVTSSAATLGGALTVAGAMEISDDMFVQSANGDNALSVDTQFGIVTVGSSSPNGDLIVGSSVTADALTLGSPAAASLTGTKMVVTTMEIQTALRLGSATDGISFNDITTGSSGSKLRLYGNSRNVRAVTLTPEYAGAVLSGTGTGTMIAGYDSTARKNYYRWNSSEATAQTYSVVVRYTLPTDWTGWSPGAGICLDTWTSSTSLGLITLSVDGTDDLADLSSQSVTPGGASTWANTCFTLDGSQYTAGGVMEVRLTLSAEDAASVEIGPLRLTYLSSF